MKNIIFYGGGLIFTFYVWWIFFNIFKWDMDKTTFQVILFTGVLTVLNAILAFPFFISISGKSKNFALNLEKYNINFLPIAWKISLVMSYIVVIYELHMVVVGLLLTLAAYM